MGKTILLVHGRNFKPNEADLTPLRKDALRFGIERDHPRKAAAFRKARIEMVYYGDLSNAYLRSIGREYKQPADLRNRKQTSADLQALGSSQFTKGRYRKLPGKTSIKEAIADGISAPLHWFGLSDNLIRSVAPDMGEYWNPDSAFGSEVRYRMIAPLRKAHDRGDKVLVIAHSLGTMIAYDTFWKFSRYGEYRDYWSKKIDMWITLGSPLADETVKDRLKGARAKGERRFPSNIVRWENVAAEDDYISHDQKVKNDFKKMLRFKLVKRLKDHRMYNLAVRHGKSNPHSSAGYLISPTVSSLVASWL